MKHIINEKNSAVKAMLSAYHFEHQDRLAIDTQHNIIYQKDVSGVSLISGGGSGHEPAHFGYVGEGMLSASVSGDLFTPPFPDAILRAIERTDTGAGALLIVKNFASDVEVFTEAKRLAKQKGHHVEMVIVSDDVSVDNKETYSKRKRGVAGTVLIYKILGYFKQHGLSLSELCTIADDLMPHLFTLGVALSSAALPETDPFFSLASNEVYFGVGIHGEKGYRKEPFQSSEQLAIELYNKLKHLHRFKPGEQYAFLINGLGATPLLEQYVFSHDIKRLAHLDKITIDFIKTGTQLSSYNMHGISLSCLKITDPRFKEALRMPVAASHW
ncbi:DhaKLM operon coactivator DhaQ [Halolactibacillus alkaliphilus]|uniref:DhaKLM operon coactivator DhaQ n=1 Tax=Halolactibacillus alkaliphilus TaxID=442899 RepID=A0A511WZI4_9BACI|nr:dihydroxyacetone kinase subunit DhaK [Halolactibacillus alkaliphilus]GEN56103.1 DhaKLM operon coactivator DhaQ [Halolactibacillus alkaliphilus]GGN67193.1 DhaKLM operon coactivator DhaQ [Halolactibacillus alkaliphilus]SFO71411.1 dihydroxyacetone kinase [Halolactibacillus alkaliphilus]